MKQAHANIFSLLNVSKRFGDKTVLKDFTLDILKDRTTVLLGPSGCGKSTILRLCLGLTAPTQGRVLFEGAPIAPGKGDAIRRKMGYVIQDGGLFPHMTARENVCIMARYLKWPREKMAARLDELREMTNFPQDGLSSYPAQLSGGQQQRVALMRALMLDPDVLLMDEPLGALDSIIRHRLQNDLKDIFSRLRKTVVMVTHDIGEAGFFGDKVVLMRGGAIEQAGRFADLVHKPANGFVREYIAAQRGVADVLENAG
ncbi:MAG: ATP-binding cassette domain-containing protein [Alphaproteobacteria bacterium]|nr:ATP-binding cassette domain-containing protein [Alphaproteobacteria bacterium]